MAFNQPIEIGDTGHVGRDARAAGGVPPPSAAFRFTPEELDPPHEITTATPCAAAPVPPATDGTVRLAESTTC